MEPSSPVNDDPPAVAATPPLLAEHVAGLLGLDVLEAGPAVADASHRPLLVVVTAATARSVIDGGLVRALGGRLQGVVCWHVAAADLPPVLEHLAAAGVPGFVGVPTHDELMDAMTVCERGLRYEEDILIAKAIARYEAELGERSRA